MALVTASKIGGNGKKLACFREWVRRNRTLAKKLPLQALVPLSRIRISHSAAYRAAWLEGARGFRRNQTRYAEFWSKLNWQLPDTALSFVWSIDRANLHARRVRLGVGQPLWKLPG